jgi:hypothetical protein
MTNGDHVMGFFQGMLERNGEDRDGLLLLSQHHDRVRPRGPLGGDPAGHYHDGARKHRDA